MPRTKGKEQLTHEGILQSAVKFADEEGIENLSIRKLAGILNAGTMSLYHYFSSKDELLDAMVEFAAGKIRQPQPGESWREAITNLSVSAHQVMSRHEWVAMIWSKRTLGPNKLAFMEALLRVLREGGFSVEDAYDAYCAISVHIEGFAIQAAEFPIRPGEYKAAAKGFLAAIDDPEAIPYFIDHVQHHLDRPGPADHFKMTLEMILDGFEKRHALQRPNPTN